MQEYFKGIRCRVPGARQRARYARSGIRYLFLKILHQNTYCLVHVVSEGNDA